MTGPPRPAPPPRPDLVERFEAWMRHHRGVTERTLQGYRPVLVALLHQVGGPPGFTAEALRQVVLALSARHGRSQAKTVTKAVRMVLRYAVAHQLCDARLVDAIPTVVHLRLAALPAYLPPPDVERLVRALDVSTPVGLRDGAMLLLLARLGLRPGDLVALRLGDIDWRGARCS